MCGFVVLAACASGPTTTSAGERRSERKRTQARIDELERPGLVLGEFPLGRVVDGDTIHVEGLDSSLRLLGDDAEETFKHESDWRAYEVGWETYLKNQRGNSSHPVKMATPVGMDAKTFAEQFFAGVDTVRLERDHPKEVRDYYNRYLAYVFAKKDGEWKNYNVEIVRAGLSPYFTKYGYSRRFHAEFVTAETEARAAHRGIWDPKKQHYPDYEERKVWWDARAEFIKAFETEAAEHDNYIELTNYDTPSRLEALLGKEVVILGSISEIKHGDKGPTLLFLSRRRGNDFPIVFFDKDVFSSSKVSAHVGEYIRVKGFVAKYENQARGKSELQIKIDLPSQIVVATPDGHVQ